ncbi:MAG TPA: helix-turn-helix domain-containing protein [Lachnospiraceae bacterium]|nr:helix-turn-helix domain-containing protein [Lachnospiraceae bacterium]
MDWIERMNSALEYIEENLEGEIRMGEAARRACCSEYHFTRMFSFITDIPLNEYIRRRRLTLAGLALKNSDVRIIDLANRYGYDSPNSFSRAFQTMHGVMPSKARNLGVELKSFAPISFLITVKGGTGLNYKIVEENSQTLFGVSFITKKDCAYESIPEFWERCERDRITHRIVEVGHGDEKTLLRAVLSELDAERMKYMIGLVLPVTGVPDEFDIVDIPARTWAVFPIALENPEDSIISIWKRIFIEWFPSSGYELHQGPWQERCYWREDGKMIVEAWVPVVSTNREGLV